ncbi:PTS transporter subunit EIIC [Brachybacterium sp. JHP9]|uniref:PTS transporter subunit EIIC n=1 Tax=Brachybacterium equifaecis TaxID=2910770 RepID=A0ABT0QY78_9MICO|nr:PTS transporter subunit EIIC [Brachybacterium equifaecis]MCL6422627.1 PTS transporter subunit EIIC [Brachybacterium equifaecis]
MATTSTQTTASEIIDAIGGPQNVASLSHCATRLRFQLNDQSAADQKRLDSIPGVMGVVPQGSTGMQVIIGGAVQNVYNDINALPAMASAGAAPAAAKGGELSDEEIKAQARAGGVRGRFSGVDKFFEFLSDSFRPIIGALLGASLIITFMSLMSTLGVIGNWADPRTALPESWQFVNLMWQSVFVFLPLMVAYNASKKLGADPWVGFAIMAMVMLPGFTALGQSDVATQQTVFGSEVTIVEIFGLPLTIFGYASQVFPPLLMAALLGPLYKLLRRIIPTDLQLIFVPFIALVIMLPLTAFLIGPIGVYLGAFVANVLGSINDFSPLVFAIVVPLAYPFMVPLGLHWPINAVMLLNIAQNGSDYIQGPMGAWNFACFGATAGVLFLSIRDREKQMRQTATGALAAGLLGGISEPSLYGIHLRFKRIYPLMLVGCLVGGLIIGIGGGVNTSAFVFTSLLTIPAFDNIPLYAAGVLSAFVVSMLMVIFFDYRTKEQKAEALAAKTAAERGDAAVDPAQPVDDARVAADASQARPVAAPVAAAAPAAAAAPVAGGADDSTDAQRESAGRWIEALGGAGNVQDVSAIAATRVRVAVKDSSLVRADALAGDGVAAAQVGEGVWHLVPGLDAEQYAGALRSRLS